jgi:hypothetical protein
MFTAMRPDRQYLELVGLFASAIVDQTIPVTHSVKWLKSVIDQAAGDQWTDRRNARPAPDCFHLF